MKQIKNKNIEEWKKEIKEREYEKSSACGFRVKPDELNLNSTKSI
ncbi:MAG: hypothetical protein ACOC1P_00810 [Minisyncoccales bacterium]